MKVYIAGGLTNIGNYHLKDIYKKLGKLCVSQGLEAYAPHLSGMDPVKNPEVTPQVVWHNDHRHVASADLVIAYVGVPSLGVGAELEIARATASDIVLWYFKGEKVSRMALGNPSVKHRIEAENEKDLYTKLLVVLASYKG
ncbi:MAG: hypothetical protein A3J06_00255 [Candidatus Moranbacteria bacterium RIFCSPLOWO2_02_FULL_48_19]|nr:MAG: hypothetical protein A3J06_00255 [Candidatus Moranbacteria bacterium RIFCSPLOWO2_02_FULL_48_19]OGI31664.1 MAG: hypothetical protein A3G09_02330 [Candidatus Moranbacteria bacterium RIFCSPLOWO2_12_FULL_48_12]